VSYKVIKYSKRFLRSLVNQWSNVMTLLKCKESKAKLSYYMTWPFVNMIN